MIERTSCSTHLTNFYCPWCDTVIREECGYDHAYRHQDKGPYAVTVMEAFEEE